MKKAVGEYGECSLRNMAMPLCLRLCGDEIAPAQALRFHRPSCKHAGRSKAILKSLLRT